MACRAPKPKLAATSTCLALLDFPPAPRAQLHPSPIVTVSSHEREFRGIHTASYPDGDDVRGRIGRGDSPQLSPDGSEVYYIDRTPGREGIYARPTRGGVAQRRVASARGIALQRRQSMSMGLGAWGTTWRWPIASTTRLLSSITRANALDSHYSHKLLLILKS